MSDIEGTMVECDQCGKSTERSKIVQDKGVNYPELLKKAKDDDRDFVNLCHICADVDLPGEKSDKNDVKDKMSNIRQFL